MMDTAGKSGLTVGVFWSRCENSPQYSSLKSTRVVLQSNSIVSVQPRSGYRCYRNVLEAKTNYLLVEMLLKWNIIVVVS